MKSSKRTDSQGQLLAALIAILVIIGTTGFVWFWMQKQSPPPQESQSALPPNAVLETPQPTQTPTPRSIPHGKWGFGISTGQPGPKPGEGSLDPYDPAVGTKQTITLHVTDSQPVQSVRATVQTDTKKHPPIEFKRISGTDLSGDWQGSWVVDDTYLYTYMISFEAKSQNGTTKVDSLFR